MIPGKLRSCGAIVETAFDKGAKQGSGIETRGADLFGHNALGTQTGNRVDFDNKRPFLGVDNEINPGYSFQIQTSISLQRNRL